MVFGCRLVSEVPNKEDCFFRRSSSWAHGRCLVRIGDAHEGRLKTAWRVKQTGGILMKEALAIETS